MAGIVLSEGPATRRCRNLIAAINALAASCERGGDDPYAESVEGCK